MKSDQTGYLNKEQYIVRIQEVINLVKREQPLIHIIPNGVSAAFTADAAAAAGARPLMAVSEREIEEITSHAGALVVNMGQPTEEKRSAALLALSIAGQQSIPVVLDPVGAGASGYREEILRELEAVSWEGIIKGNCGEIHTMQTGQLKHQGIDSLEEEEIIQPPDDRRILAVTGRRDRILMKEQIITLKHDSYRVYPLVGTGCMAGILCGVYYAAEPDRGTAAAAGLTAAAYVQEMAATACGYGSCKAAVLDEISRIDTGRLGDYLYRNLDVQITGC